jgi:hypothetical protein
LSANRLDDKKDLIALHPGFDKDWLVRLFELPCLRILFVDSHVDESIALFLMQKINRVAATIAMLLAAVLFIGAIVSLYLTKDNNVRLGLICVFTIAFSLSTHLLTNARRAELFTSTAAYVCFTGSRLYQD